MAKTSHRITGKGMARPADVENRTARRLQTELRKKMALKRRQERARKRQAEKSEVDWRIIPLYRKIVDMKNRVVTFSQVEGQTGIDPVFPLRAAKDEARSFVERGKNSGNPWKIIADFEIPEEYDLPVHGYY